MYVYECRRDTAGVCRHGCGPQVVLSSRMPVLASIATSLARSHSIAQTLCAIKNYTYKRAKQCQVGQKLMVKSCHHFACEVTNWCVHENFCTGMHVHVRMYVCVFVRVYIYVFVCACMYVDCNGLTYAVRVPAYLCNLN